MLAWLGGLLAALVCVDMGIKQYIEDHFKTGEEKETRIPKVVLRKVHNRGFLLDILEERPQVIRIVSIATGVFVAIYDVWLYFRKGQWVQKIGMVFMSAGAISNIYDRLARGKVIDYIGFQSKGKFLSKITANLADFYVLIGAILVEGDLSRRRKIRKRKKLKQKKG